MSKKEEILKIASKEFAKYGYKGVVLDRIAKKANITKAAIYYHFKNKQDLYENVLSSKIEELVSKIKSCNNQNPIEDLKCYISVFATTFKKYPCFASILAHEFVDGGRNLSENILKNLSQIFNTLVTILNNGVEKKVFEIDNPFTIQLMIVSSLIMNQTTKELRKKISKFIEIPINPNIEDISNSLTQKILKAISKDTK